MAYASIGVGGPLCVTSRSITLACSARPIGAKSYSSSCTEPTVRRVWTTPVPGTYSMTVGVTVSEDFQVPVVPTRTPG